MWTQLQEDDVYAAEPEAQHFYSSIATVEAGDNTTQTERELVVSEGR